MKNEIEGFGDVFRKKNRKKLSIKANAFLNDNIINDDVCGSGGT